MFVLNHVFTLPVGESQLTGELTLPQQATGLVMLAHSASGQRASARCRHIRRLLQQEDLGTFSVDLLTPREKYQPNSDSAASLLTQRLVTAVRWARRQSSLLGLRIGLLGQDEMASIVLNASLELNLLVGATVSLGGHVAQMPSPSSVPTLLLAGEAEAACAPEAHAFTSPSQVRTVAHADSLFQEHSALAQATQQAAAWFTVYLAKASNTHAYQKE